jgi:RNA polymerase-binding transcription factor DksA
MLSPERLQRWRDQFSEEQKGLQEDLDNLRPDLLVTDTNSGVGNHPAEDADLTWQQEQIVSLRLNQQNILDRIKHALKQMDDGTYGICARCGPGDRLRPPQGPAARNPVHGLPESGGTLDLTELCF